MDQCRNSIRALGKTITTRCSMAGGQDQQDLGCKMQREFFSGDAAGFEIFEEYLASLHPRSC